MVNKGLFINICFFFYRYLYIIQPLSDDDFSTCTDMQSGYYSECQCLMYVFRILFQARELLFLKVSRSSERLAWNCVSTNFVKDVIYQWYRTECTK